MAERLHEFEIHLTVAADQAAATRLREFCAARGLKCTHIVLSRGTTPQQPMLSCRRTGSRAEIDTEVAALADELRKLGLDPVRIKLECSPLSEGVPQTDDEAVDGSRYFEHHVKLLQSPAGSVAPLEAISERHGAHLSRNAFKHRGDGQEERFVTLRCFHVGRLRAERQLADLLSDLGSAGFVVLDVESEYSLFDSRLELDAGW
jgi:hypothetical protein